MHVAFNVKVDGKFPTLTKERKNKRCDERLEQRENKGRKGFWPFYARLSSIFWGSARRCKIKINLEVKKIGNKCSMPCGHASTGKGNLFPVFNILLKTAKKPMEMLIKGNKIVIAFHIFYFNISLFYST